MNESSWTVITPEYLTAYGAEIETFLQTYLGPAERAELSAKIVGVFSAFREDELQRNFSVWMRRALEKRHLGQVEAGEIIGVRHSSVGRWLSGKTEMPIDRFRKFYLLFGGEDENDHPLIPVGDLNLRGYCVAVGYMRQILEAAEDAGPHKKDVSLRKLIGGLDADKLVPLGTMTFLWLNYYFSSFEVLAQIDMRAYQQYSKWIMLRGVYDHFHLFDPSRDAWGTLESMNKELDVWGMPWLLTVRLLAEASGGIAQDCVSAGYPARFKRWKK